MFKDPALDLLWELCFYLPRLVSALPSHAVVRDEQNNVVDIRPLTREEWTRFHTYSARIREVGISEWGPTSNALLALLAAPPAYIGRAFPKLRRIVIQELKGQLYFPDYRFLLGPLVNCVDLRLGEIPSENDALTQSIIQSIPEVCPKLRYLAVSWSSRTPPPWASQVVSEAVSRLDSLWTLRCPALNTCAIMHVSQLRSMEALALDLFPPSGSLSSNSGTAAIYEFSGLYSLDLTAKTMDKAAIFLRQLTSLPDCLTINLGASPHVSEVESFIGYLDGRHNRDFDGLTLRGRHGYVEPISSIPDPGPPVTLQILRPLLQYQWLRTLEIEMPSPIHLTDANIEDMTIAWPYLQTFTLNQHHGWGASSATIKSLYNFIWYCQDLEYLGMSIDASQLCDAPENMPADGYSNKHLVHLQLGDSRVRDPAVLALVLSTIFTSKFLYVCFSAGASFQGEEYNTGHSMALADCIEEVREREAEGITDEESWPPPQDVVKRLRKTFKRSLRRRSDS
ncbi:hypothetical protein CONPUDRAFT_156615 [Coniophora puteana RWD-64-598 SS2]|uniref:F-box domain-containing protein n=1 Tax=Coniophora puteana (strain RWD-64-598) TaxID=741705 RepID=A0A5M3MHD8_CONPW|nr:uncharacterized protein CONPUDRAFT_156615 [Coniophora puteana RWD-64-598 SS2]EIW78649.1 hypothetical protein CONPUDRAFT_156615 [Coniophora puteana RWD-64-598 SS2]